MSLVPSNKNSNSVVYTPVSYTKAIVEHFKPTGSILEPCYGGGSFYDVYPAHLNKDWCEIAKGRDFFDYNSKVDWIITNPPFDLMRKFLNKAMSVADNVVFLTTINHLWLTARLRDVRENNFGVKEIALCDTPKTFPQSGFQVGCFHLQRDYKGAINFSYLEVKD